MNGVDASKIVGGPGNPTVNAFVETYDRQAEMRVRSLRHKQKQEFSTAYTSRLPYFECKTKNGTMIRRGAFQSKNTGRTTRRVFSEECIIGCNLAQGHDFTGGVRCLG